MPKLIDYPRTSYTGAWELAEIVDDTGGKCSIETAARKLNRKVSGSFKAIIGSAVKFGLMTSKRELLTTTTLFKRIKHAYDKAEELQFHREAFLTPPLFTQVCRKFRGRELPVQMLDVMLIREFGVEEINAQNVAKAFVDGCRMCGLIDELNIIADIDAMNSRTPRRALASVSQDLHTFTQVQNTAILNVSADLPESTESASQHNTSSLIDLFEQPNKRFILQQPSDAGRTEGSTDAIANLFGLDWTKDESKEMITESDETVERIERTGHDIDTPPQTVKQTPPQPTVGLSYKPKTLMEPSKLINPLYQMQMSGPGVNTALDITEEADVAIAIALLEKIRRQLRASS